MAAAAPISRAQGDLLAAQVEGIEWLFGCWSKRTNSILADEEALGKGIQATGLLGKVYSGNEKGVPNPSLIVTTLGTLSQWSQEIEHWAPQLRCLLLYGSSAVREEKKRTQWIDDSPCCSDDATITRFRFHVLLTTYEHFVAERAILRGVPWECMIVSQAERLKNPESLVMQCLNSVNKNYLLLICNSSSQSIGEKRIFAHMLDPIRFPFSEPATDDMLRGIDKFISERTLRRTSPLPPTINSVEQLMTVELSSTQKKVYSQFLKTFKSTDPHTQLLGLLVNLMKCCSHPWLLPNLEQSSCEGLTNPHDISSLLISESGKLSALDKLLSSTKPEAQVLIISQAERVLDILEDFIIFRGHTYTRGSSQEPEPTIIPFVTLLHANALSSQLPLLHRIDTLIIFDRVLLNNNVRLGFGHNATIYRMVTRNTVEQLIQAQTGLPQDLPEVVSFLQASVDLWDQSMETD
ncbi:Chromodomain-helicase-DNA-binding protein 3 [Pelomyxa schiedti]|nr:Chromodomain-helicase-DNA-binding protein 3 [Pelomyxa schiedti]